MHRLCLLTGCLVGLALASCMNGEAIDGERRASALEATATAPSAPETAEFVGEPIAYEMELDDHGELADSCQPALASIEYGGDVVEGCDMQLMPDCCHLDLWDITGVPIRGALVGVTARNCSPRAYLWIRIRKQTSEAWLPTLFWEHRGKKYMTHCLSSKSYGLIFTPAEWGAADLELEPGTYEIEAELQTGRVWVPPHPFKPWLGGYFDQKYCAREAIQITVPD